MSASASVRIYTPARIYVYARSSELRSSVSERRKERKRERAEKERGRERVESTAEVEGRLASIRERDADRVGESWVRSHKEVDTRRHLNPPCPPSRRPPRAPSVLLGATSPPLPPSHREPPIRLPSPSHSSVVPSLYFAHSRSVRLAPGIYCSSFSLSLPPSVAILSLHRRSLRVALFPPSRRETHPRSRSAKLRLPEDRRGWLEDFFVTTGRCCAS